MAHAAELSFRQVPDCQLAIISPNDPAAMVQYAQECQANGVRYIFDPGQQCARMSGEELLQGTVGATIVIVNTTFELLKQKTGLDQQAILARSEALIVTRGEHGSSVFTPSDQTDVPAVTPRRIVDPTGVGDAFRGGFMKGLALGLSYAVSARLGSVAATYALEHLGGQSHTYSLAEFMSRYHEHFPALGEVVI
jgi:adenosine kinase